MVLDDEYKFLLDNNTWTLIQPEARDNLIGTRWVFKIKRKSEGSIERYKARLRDLNNTKI